MNVLNAIFNIANAKDSHVKNFSKSHIRVNSAGDSLELYVKKAFTGLLDKDTENPYEEYRKIFSYEGSQNNPPDLMLKGGDAIEVKKIESAYASLSLNSSYPKDKLYASSKLITKECRECEDWTEKDIIYATGTVKDEVMTRLSFVYGVNYAAREDTYTSVIGKIKNSIERTPEFDFSDTNELGRLNNVDPLKITYFRMRGMWGIVNPWKVFEYVVSPDAKKQFNFFAIIQESKYLSFPSADRKNIESCKNLKITDVEIKNPNNPMAVEFAKLFTISR